MILVQINGCIFSEGRLKQFISELQINVGYSCLLKDRFYRFMSAAENSLSGRKRGSVDGEK